MKTPIPQTWRLIAAALRRFLKPEVKQPAPVPPGRTVEPLPDKPYEVESYDNYDAPSERLHLKHGRYATAAEGHAAGLALIDRQLLDGIASGKTAEQALDQWLHFGEVPMVFGPTRVALDPFSYAQRRAAELSAAQDDPDGAKFRRFMARATELDGDAWQLELF